MKNTKKTAKKKPMVNELFKKLEDGVKNVYSSETWKSMLKFQSAFHNYSFNNMLLIYLQCPNATRVAGYGDWQKLERQVQYGETAIKIMAPNFKKERNEITGEEKKVLTGFHQTSVFDISQTKGKDLPQLCKELKGDTASLRQFYELAKSISPFPVDEVTLKDGSKGYFSHETVSIGIKKGMAVKQKCKTLIHELAHGLLHRMDDPRRETLTRGDREIEAEGTAFVVLSYFGFDTSEYSFPYVASWNGTTAMDSIQRAGEIIQKTAEKIINQLNEEMNESTEAA
jgi:hypothetical protein